MKNCYRLKQKQGGPGGSNGKSIVSGEDVASFISQFNLVREMEGIQIIIGLEWSISNQS